MSDQKPPPDLRDLDRRLREMQQRYEPPASERPPETAMGLAMRAGVELVAGFFVGGAIGYGFDLLLGSSPWGLVVFFILGGVAGILTVVRSAMRSMAEQDRNDRKQG
ncbi:AtpZ/AtpI family protein [Zavarzinia sp. CC-PAN008]|uniref:AtpZ/AtpI family protein n=1 Tax=Zavarzinia sp. CC-PAN008 TaxID=3243332 RepID=UPI003F742D04